jgi:hypothetical protein
LTDLGVGVDFGEYPWFVPGAAISIVLAVLLAGAVARRLGISRGVAWLLLASLGTIVAVTLTPARGAPLPALFGQATTCDLTRIGPAQWAEYLQLGDTTFNVVLFIPLGVAIGLLGGSRRNAAIILGAIILPFAIEAIQAAATPLGRACQSADVFDNLTGLALGLAVGGTWTVLRRLQAANSDRHLP